MGGLGGLCGYLYGNWRVVVEGGERLNTNLRVTFYLNNKSD